jgi:hypothetical protein
MREVNRKFKDHYGKPVRVIRWEPETRRVIYLREGYPTSALAHSISFNASSGK